MELVRQGVELIGAVGISVPSQYASMKYFTRATAPLGALINSAVLQGGGVEKVALSINSTPWEGMERVFS